MSKRKSAKKSRIITKTHHEDSSWEPDLFADNRLSKLRVFRIFTLTIGMAGLLYLLLNQTARKSFFESLPQGLSQLWGILFVLSFFFRIIFISIRDQNQARMMADVKYARRIILTQTINQIFFLALIAIPIIYISGLTNAIAEYFHSIFPRFSVNVGNILLSVLTFLISGIIGNAGYDWLKTILSKRKNGALLKKRHRRN